ncbi:MAG TPA: hypothetical protein VFR70_07450 [Flavobacterium sp.]|nr:hypothetical protein [Flavobacterium sp.]
MKKLLFALFVLSLPYFSLGQTLLDSRPLKLKNPKSSQQILNAANENGQVFAFAADKERVVALKYNKALFFSDSLSIPRPDKEYEFMAGYSFDENGSPYVYWANEDFTKMQSVYLGFENKASAISVFNLPSNEETIAGTFSKNNAFYIVALPKKENSLKIYVFSKNKLQEKVLDFSAYSFVSHNGKTKKFNEFIQEEGLQFIEEKVLNPLYRSVGISKAYAAPGKLLLTADSPSQTQILEIDLNSFSVSQKIILQQALAKEGGRANSYYAGGNLYQIKANQEEIAIAAAAVESGTVLKRYSATASDTIFFKNSPLYSQTGNKRGRALKNTKKFLQRLSDAELGISAYKTSGPIMLTIGGIRYVSSAGDIILGITAGAAMAAADSGGGNISSFFDGQNRQSIFFESLFDAGFKHQDSQQQPLAFDSLAQFLDENEVALESVFPYRDYFILSYYNAKTKEFVMRKFEDSY